MTDLEIPLGLYINWQSQRQTNFVIFLLSCLFYLVNSSKLHHLKDYINTDQ